MRRMLVFLLTLSLMGFSALPAEAQTARRLLFEEIFGGNYSGWELGSTTGSFNVTQNAVTIEVGEESKAVWITPALTVPDDIEIEVEARAIEPDSSGNWNLAVLLRVSSRDLNSTFYHFGVAGNGTWEFSVRPPEASKYVDNIERGKLTGFDANRPIQLRVLASGNTFTFYVNGRLIRQFVNNTLPVTPDREHFFGLMAGTYSGVSKHKVEFRKIAVYEVVRQRALFRDTFPDSNPNAWGTGSSANSNVYLENNSLVFEVLRNNVLSWSRPNKSFPRDVDVRAEVISDPSNQGRGWSYGIGVRAYKDGEDAIFHFFEVRGTGEFTFTVQRGGSTLRTLISARRIANFDAQAKHTLRVLAVGDVFTLFVDDQQVGSVRSSDPQPRDEYGILLAAGTFAAPSARLRFTNVVVLPPR
ncbi:MAG: hypothetical protein J7551_03810 [Chloroflexi bacterium]|nr:hypothetical protein [Chloroflexota bacterium]